jgi:hypothetical protein
MGYLYEACDQISIFCHQYYVSTMLNNDIKSSPKPLWSFIKSKRCDSTGVAPLSKGGNNHSGSLEKANILNDQFTSVFTEEDTTNDQLWVHHHFLTSNKYNQ